MKLSSWDDAIIDIYPPFNHITLAFLSCRSIKCPKCQMVYFKKEVNMDHPYQPVNCKRCNFIGTFTDWQIELLLQN